MSLVIRMDHWILENIVTAPVHLLERRFDTTKYGIAWLLALLVIAFSTLGTIATLSRPRFQFWDAFGGVGILLFFVPIASTFKRQNREALKNPATLTLPPRKDHIVSTTRLLGVAVVLELLVVIHILQFAEVERLVMQMNMYDTLSIFCVVLMVYVVDVSRASPTLMQPIPANGKPVLIGANL